MSTRLKRGKRVSRIVPTRTHDARVIYHRDEMEVSIIHEGGEALVGFRIVGTRKTEIFGTVDGLYEYLHRCEAAQKNR